jgi:1-deoxy-D-xylulose-5-phosphate reductoisomerase
MNKGLEIIEAHYLFDIAYSKIEAVIHPQSIIHSMVEYVDGSTLAQMSPPNMKGPIGYALGYPDRLKGATHPMDWTRTQNLDFAPIDSTRFEAIDLARAAGELGSIATATLNAANESAVAAFIDGAIHFSEITQVNKRTLAHVDSARGDVRDLADVSAVEENARMLADRYIKELSH